MNAHERSEQHYLKVAQKLRTEQVSAKSPMTEGTPQQRSERHYLAIARKMKGSL
jgi:hypothetical protein